MTAPIVPPTGLPSKIAASKLQSTAFAPFMNTSVGPISFIISADGISLGSPSMKAISGVRVSAGTRHNLEGSMHPIQYCSCEKSVRSSSMIKDVVIPRATLTMP